MKLATKIAYNTIIQVAGRVISVCLGLAAIALITRYLGQTGFGEYTTIITFLSFFAIVADLGLTLVTVQLISPANANQEKILGNLLGLRLVSAIFFLGLAPISALFFPYSRLIKIGILAATWSFLFPALNQILIGLFQKNLRLDKVAIAEIANRIVLLAGVILAIRLNGGLIGVIIASIISGLINFLILFILSRRFARIRLYFDFSYWQEIIKKTWPLAVTIIFNLIYLKADTLLLSMIKRKSEIGIMAEVGLYGAAYRVIDVVVAFPFIFAGIILPVLTAYWLQKNESEFKKILQRSFDVMVIIAIPLIVGTQLVAEEIMVLVAGQNFAEAGPILQVLILAAGFIFLGNMFAHAIIALDQQKKIIRAYAFVAVSSVIGYLVFIPKFSYFGAAGVTIYSEFAIAFASYLLVFRATRFIPDLKIFLKSLLASGVMFIGIYLFYFFITDNLLFVISGAILIYFLFLFIFRGLSRDDFKILLNK